MISVETIDLSKNFGEVRALDRVNLKIEPGEIFFLLGPSGCGKTTLLRTVAGFYTPESGQILFDGKEVTRLPPHQRNTGMMFQSYALWPHMTVEKNVAFGLEERRVPRPERQERVREALASVQMEEYATRKIHQLSGGQQQRVALARAMVIRPRCLLLDEPLSNLDANLRLEMRGEIRSACKTHGLTAIYVTHDQKEALSIADRLAILQKGVIRQIGTPAEVYRAPHSSFVAGFIGETNFLPGKIDSLDGKTVRVRTEVGIVAAGLTNPRWSPSPDECVQISIRPESLTIEPMPGAEFSITGEVIEATYLGETVQYGIRAAQASFKVVELNPHGKTLQPGQPCTVSARAEDVIILPGDAA